MTKLEVLTKEMFEEKFGKGSIEYFKSKSSKLDLTSIWDHAFIIGFKKAIELTDRLSIEELKSFDE